MQTEGPDLSDPQRFWDSVWTGGADRDFWTQADPEVARLVAMGSPRDRPEVLDLGCGLGRHAVAFARAGYQVTAVDVSVKALAHVRRWAGELGLSIRTQAGHFAEERFPPEAFDWVLAVNVIYHGLPDDFARAIANTRTWLRSGGRLYFTCPTLEDGEYGRGRRVARHTFELEPGHVHFNAAWEDLAPLLDGLRMLYRKRRDHHWEQDAARQFSSRWQVLVEKP
jgi:SAM-dependent methyltransferase